MEDEFATWAFVRNKQNSEEPPSTGASAEAQVAYSSSITTAFYAIQDMLL